VDPGIVDINTDLGYQDGEAAGTGMVITSSGEVFTNNHVIVGATKITATDLGNGNTYTARVVGYDRGHDIAVLQLEGASGLKTVSLGDSSSVATGAHITTIGNAGGTGGTPAAAGGQVTAVNQSITAGDDLDGSQEHLSGLIELAGDLQPGDSGGPLVNSSGDVVGMDTAASSTFEFQSSSGQGFAIPISKVETIAREILNGTTTGMIHIGATPFLGVKINSTSSASGAAVADVISGTPAASTTLADGDVITALDGSSVGSPTDLSNLVLSHHPGDSVRITWKTAAGSTHTAAVTLASGPPQ
jgi:S1-C subfamily serine protease